jgi:hypothetical protein
LHVPVLIYTGLRLALFVVATALLWAFVVRSWIAPLGGLVIAWALGYLLLARQRAAATAWLQAREAARGSSRVDEDAAYEDAVDEASRGEA